MTLRELKTKYDEFKTITDENEALEAVQQNGYALKYVNNQTPEIVLAAVRQNGYALQHVNNQTPEIALEAVRQNGDALKYVNNQTPEIALEAVRQNGDALKYVNTLIFRYLEPDNKEIIEQLKNIINKLEGGL